MAGRRLLISYAHPDDESFGLGAAIPKWIDDGVDVYLICATNGDAGHVPVDLQGKYPSVAELRLSELNCARQYLKFKEVFMLGVPRQWHARQRNFCTPGLSLASMAESSAARNPRCI